MRYIWPDLHTPAETLTYLCEHTSRVSIPAERKPQGQAREIYESGNCSGDGPGEETRKCWHGTFRK